MDGGVTSRFGQEMTKSHNTCSKNAKHYGNVSGCAVLLVRISTEANALLTGSQKLNRNLKFLKCNDKV